MTEQSDTAHNIQPGSGRDLFFLDKIILVLSDVPAPKQPPQNQTTPGSPVAFFVLVPITNTPQASGQRSRSPARHDSAQNKRRGTPRSTLIARAAFPRKTRVYALTGTNRVPIPRLKTVTSHRNFPKPHKYRELTGTQPHPSGLFHCPPQPQDPPPSHTHSLKTRPASSPPVPFTYGESPQRSSPPTGPAPPPPGLRPLWRETDTSYRPLTARPAATGWPSPAAYPGPRAPSPRSAARVNHRPAAAAANIPTGTRTGKGTDRKRKALLRFPGREAEASAELPGGASGWVAGKRRVPVAG